MTAYCWRRYLPLVVLLCTFPLTGCATSGHATVRPEQIVMPYKYGGELDLEGFNEPSGAVYNAERDSVFVVGDEGDICEIKTDGEVLRAKHLRPGDFEGITLNPATGLLYVAEEGKEKILEIEPDSFEILREFTLPRSFQGEVTFKEGGNGIEAITFVPQNGHPEGGTFYVGNQSFSLEPGDEKSLLVEVVVPLKSNGNPGKTVRILRTFSPGVIDVSALHYSSETDTLYFLSDASNTFYEVDRGWNFLRARAFPGSNQEGLAIDGKGTMYIAQDSGGILVISPYWLQQKE